MSRLHVAFAVLLCVAGFGGGRAIAQPELSGLVGERLGFGDVGRRAVGLVRGAGFDVASERLGIGRAQLVRYGRDGRLLRATEAMLGEGVDVPRETGRVSAGLAGSAAAGDVAGSLRELWGVLGVSAGRGIAAPGVVDAAGGVIAAGDDETLRAWGVGWLDGRRSDGGALSPMEALGVTLERIGVSAEESDRVEAYLEGTPVAVRRLVVRLLVAHERSRGWVSASVDGEAVRVAVERHMLAGGASPLALASVEDAYAAGIAPFQPMAGWVAEPRRPVLESLGLLDAVDLPTMAYGSLLHAALVQQAIEEFRAWRFATGWDGGSLDGGLDRGVRFVASWGVVRITGPGDDLTSVGRGVDLEEIAREGGRSEPGGLALLVDLGGDDRYVGRVGATGLRGVTAGGTRVASAVSTVVDLGGADEYVARGSALSIGAGFFGVAMVADLGGDDRYLGGASSIARGLYGCGVVVDYAGDDTYSSQGPFSEGSAHVGVGLLIDMAGDDEFVADSHAQGFGGTLGAGALVNLGGNDRYTARAGVNTGEAYLGRAVSMSQGVGMGRRADFGDGHSLAGGFGFLVDTSGNDVYSAGVWAQGAGYWWGVGALEDWSGEDRYESDWWSMGAGVHFSVGSFVDLGGDDLYNMRALDGTGSAFGGREGAVTRYLGAARDGAVALAFDGGGDDRYFVRARSLGHADLGSLGVFVDVGGRDVYDADVGVAGDDGGGGAALPFAGDGALGTVTAYGRWNSFRDELLTTAVFIDGGGEDTYLGEVGAAVGDGLSWERSAGERGLAAGADVGGG